MAGIFKAYDIRGVYPAQIDGALAEKIGYAVGIVLGAGEIAVGGDMRLSTPELKQGLIEGLLSTGANVTDIGRVTTPMTYFAVGKFKFGGGVMVTASHNPAQYNGFKICRADAYPVSYDSGIAEVEKIATSGKIKPAAKKGVLKKKEVLAAYRDHVLSFAKNIASLKVVADAGNGMEGVTLPLIFEKLPCQFTGLYLDPDGTFPHHEANPLELKNMQDLIRKVKETGADMGAAFDGDADRAAFVDEKGEVIPNDLMTTLIAQEVLSREPGAAIIYDLRSSRIVKEEIEKLGGRALESRVGHSYIKSTMRDVKAAFGGELSGHFYFRDNFYTDSAILAMMALLNLMSEKKKPLSEIVKPLRKYFATGEVNFTVAHQDAKIAELESRYADGEIAHLDGVTVCYRDWWFNVRKSNTEPVLRLNLEAATQRLRDEKRRELEKILTEKSAR